MATLTIRNLDENVKRELRKHAAERGVSMEQEARDRLAESLRERKKSVREDQVCRSSLTNRSISKG